MGAEVESSCQRPPLGTVCHHDLELNPANVELRLVPVLVPADPPSLAHSTYVTTSGYPQPLVLSLYTFGS
jgi:hypothetical protein